MLSALTASAAEWCSDDPAIRFVDAGGHSRTLYLTTYGDGVEHSIAVRTQAYAFTTQYGDHGRKTKLKLHVYVPDDSRNHFHVRWVLSTSPNGAGIVLAHHDGDSGHTSDFDVDLPS